MKARHLAIGVLSQAVLLIFPLAAASQAPDAGAEMNTTTPRTEGITVFAPRIVHKRERVGSRVWVTEQRALVSYSDLDLADAGDLQRMEERISDAAIGICNELSEMYPDAKPSTAVCIRRATEDVMRVAHAVAEEKAILAAFDEEG